jgi:hypothetical protein
MDRHYSRSTVPMLLALLVHACTCAGPRWPQDVSWTPGTPNTVGGRFVGAEDTVLDPKAAFGLQARCPTVRHATATPAGADVLALVITGDRLDSVQRINAGLPDGKLAEVEFVRETTAEGAPALRFPVICRSCEVWLGVRVDTATAACFGQGYSIRFEDGRIVE